MAIMLISRIPERPIFKVRGMGVAERDKISTSGYLSFKHSFAFTPNLCSSSIIRSPRLLKSILGEKRLCVPITISTHPLIIPLIISFFSFSAVKRLIVLMFTGKSENLSKKVCKCCITSIVVGAITAACLPLATHIAQALIATSVLPKLTSPQISLSIGLPFDISFSISEMAFC